MSRALQRLIRLSQEEIDRLLNRLDEQPVEGGADLRRSKRYRYRTPDLQVEFPNGEQTVRHAAPARNLSRDGVGFLLGQFVYIGTPCRVRLMSDHNLAVKVDGVVRRCRYIEGSRNVHEVGVAFHDSIDIALFHEEAATVSVLLVDDEETQRRMLMEFFKSHAGEVVDFADPDVALGEATIRPFDVVFTSLDNAKDSCQFVRQLREAGFIRPIVSYTARRSDDAQTGCPGGGCQDCTRKCLSRDTLVSMIHLLRSDPELSNRAHESERVGMINSFVASMPETVQQLEFCFQQDAEQLLRRINTLQTLAGECGFDGISSLAGTLSQAAASGVGRASLRDRLAELIRACLAARPVVQVNAGQYRRA